MKMALELAKLEVVAIEAERALHTAQIALAKARPGQLAYATPGIGAITHLAMELMLHMAKIDLLSVPYKSTGATTTDDEDVVVVMFVHSWCCHV